MNYKEIRELCLKGKVGMIPGWQGYIKWNYGLEELLFINEDYIMSEKELKLKIDNRTDLFYII